MEEYKFGKEIFEIKITVTENKDSDDKNQASVNKKLNDIFESQDTQLKW